MKRRKFISVLGATVAAQPLRAFQQQQYSRTWPVRQDWLARRKETILEPELPIVDAHHHLWERPGSRYLLDDMLADAKSGHNIVATVYVQARSMYRVSGPIEMQSVGEVEFANGIAAMGASGI